MNADRKTGQIKFKHLCKYLCTQTGHGLLQKLYNERWQDVASMEDGIFKVSRDSKFAWYDESIQHEVLARSRCDLTVLPMSEEYPLSWIYRKNFEHKDVFDFM